MEIDKEMGFQYQCGECDGVDINKDQNVDYKDLYFFMQNWLKSLY